MPWPPSSRIKNYHGPYPVRELENARRTLINRLMYCQMNSQIESLKPMIGIDNSYKKGEKPSPVLIPELRGQDVDINALPTSALTNSYESSYFITGPRTQVSERWSKHVQRARSQRAMPNGLVCDGCPNAEPGTSSTSATIAFNQPTPNSTISSADQVRRENCVGQGRADSSQISIQGNLKRKLDDNPSTESSAAKKSKSAVSIGEDGFENGSSVVVNESTSPHLWSERDIIVVEGAAPGESLKGLYLVYKCDFCPTTFGQNKEGLREHLTTAKHFSGSLYQAISRNLGTKLELVSVYSLRAVVNPSDSDINMLAACSNCEFTSKCVFTVCLHAIHQHRNNVAMYSLVTVTDFLYVTQSSKAKCLACGSEWFNNKKSKQLRKHWESYPEHAPENGLRNRHRAMFIAYCPFCAYSARENVREVRFHIIDNHGHSLHNNRMKIPIKVTTLPGKGECMPRIDIHSKSTICQHGHSSLNQEREILSHLLVKHSKNQSITQRIVKLNDTLSTL